MARTLANELKKAKKAKAELASDAILVEKTDVENESVADSQEDESPPTQKFQARELS